MKGISSLPMKLVASQTKDSVAEAIQIVKVFQNEHIRENFEAAKKKT
jgi:hypothetical protein